MRKIIEQYHPLFAASPTSALAVLYDAAGGRFRDWAKLLKVALALELGNGISKDEARVLCRAVYGKDPAATKRRRTNLATDTDADTKAA